MEQQNSKDSQPANAPQPYQSASPQHPLLFPAPKLSYAMAEFPIEASACSENRQGLMPQQESARHEPSDPRDTAMLEIPSPSRARSEPHHLSSQQTPLLWGLSSPFPLRFQWWLWLISSEQSLMCHLPWAELQHRFTHSPFLLPGDSHIHSFTRLPMQTTLVLRASEISWLPFGEGSGCAHRHLPNNNNNAVKPHTFQLAAVLCSYKCFLL